MAAKKVVEDVVAVDGVVRELTHAEYMEERVPITLFKDDGKYKEDVVLGINGEKVVIQRGKRVMLKRKFVHLLENHARQQTASAQFQEGLADEYAASQKNK